MTLSGFVLFLLGLLSEMVFLYEGAHPGLAASDPLGSSIIQRALTPTRQVLLLMGAAAGLLVGIFELVGVGGMPVSMDMPLIGIIFVALGSFTFFAAMAANEFLPVVNEQSILVVQMLMLLNALWGGAEVDWLPVALLAGLPAVVCLALIVWRWAFPAWAKALLYLWYLLSLMAIPFQDGQASFFRQGELNWAEAFSFGMLFIFLIIHGLFAARFFLMTSSLLLPRNYPLIRQIMPRLFSDEQVTPLRFFLAALLIGGLLLLNQRFGALDRSMAISLAMLLGVQVLSRRVPAAFSKRLDAAQPMHP